MLAVGSRAQVWHGTAKATGYGKKGLRRHQLKKNKHVACRKNVGNEISVSRTERKT